MLYNQGTFIESIINKFKNKLSVLLFLISLIVQQAASELVIVADSQHLELSFGAGYVHKVGGGVGRVQPSSVGSQSQVLRQDAKDHFLDIRQVWYPLITLFWFSKK